MAGAEARGGHGEAAAMAGAEARGGQAAAALATPGRKSWRVASAGGGGEVIGEERGKRRGTDVWDPHADVSKTTMKTSHGVIYPVL